MKAFAILASGVASLALAAPADAALLQFTISGLDTLSGVTPAPIEYASFRIDSTPTIESVNVAPGLAFGIPDVAGIFQYGNTVVTTPQPINFYATALRGGLVVGLDAFLAFDGPQLYIGDEATPTFRTGNFSLYDTRSRSTISLTIAAVNAVPEPASWVMMIAGFGLVGGAMRYRRRRAVVTYA